jgi:hypothetical protein
MFDQEILQTIDFWFFTIAGWRSQRALIRSMESAFATSWKPIAIALPRNLRRRQFAALKS